MRCELDLLVTPLGRPVVAGDEAGSVYAAEISVDERIPRLRLVGSAFRQAKMPLPVFVPGVIPKKCVFCVCLRLSSPQSLSRTYCRLRMSSRARATAPGLTGYLATSALLLR